VAWRAAWPAGRRSATRSQRALSALELKRDENAHQRHRDHGEHVVVEVGRVPLAVVAFPRSVVRLRAACCLHGSGLKMLDKENEGALPEGEAFPRRSRFYVCLPHVRTFCMCGSASAHMLGLKTPLGGPVHATSGPAGATDGPSSPDDLLVSGPFFSGACPRGNLKARFSVLKGHPSTGVVRRTASVPRATSPAWVLVPIGPDGILSGLMASCRSRRPFSRRSEARRSGEGLLPGPDGLRAGPRRGTGTVSGREGDLQASTGRVHEEMTPCRSRLRRRRPPGTHPPPRPRPRSLPATLATDRNGAAPKRPFVFVFTGSCSPIRAHRRLRGPVQRNAPLL
jgi:hypothetical protein